MAMVYGNPDKPAIGEAACHDCGETVVVKLNKNRIAYYYCPNCSAHGKWGRGSSQKMIAASAKASTVANEHEVEEHDVSAVQEKRVANDNARRGEQRARSGGDGGAPRSRDDEPLFGGVFGRKR